MPSSSSSSSSPRSFPPQSSTFASALPWGIMATSDASTPGWTDARSSPPSTYLDDELAENSLTGGGVGSATPMEQERRGGDPQHLELLGQLQQQAWRRRQQWLGLGIGEESGDRRTLRQRPRRRQDRGRDSVQALNGDDDVSDGSDWSGTGSTTSSYVREQETQLREAWGQLELALKVVLCPLLGKWAGRRWAYWGE